MMPLTDELPRAFPEKLVSEVELNPSFSPEMTAEETLFLKLSEIPGHDPPSPQP